LYNVAWMDTRSGNIISQTSLTASGDEPLTVDTPPIASDMAAWISRAN
jgi:hypothetical protein